MPPIEVTLDALEVVLKGRFTASDLHDWAGDSLEGRTLLAHTAWGTIRWPKSLGRPQSTALSDGLVVEREAWADFWWIERDGRFVEVRGWKKASSPSVWDGTEEPDHYVVHYMFTASADNYNRVEVRFSDVPWGETGILVRHVYRVFTPSGFDFYSASDGSLTFLPAIEIEQRTLR